MSKSTVVVPVVAGIGNSLMAVPMVRQLRRAAQRVVVVAMTSAMAEPFRRIEGVETFVTGGGTLNLIRGIRLTRNLRADVYVVPFPSNRWQYNLLAGASGAQRVVMHGYPTTRAGLGFLVRDRVPAERGLHDVVQNLRLLTALGIEPDLSDSPTFAIADADRTAADALLRGIGFDGAAPFVAVHAGSARTILAQAKRWPTARYAELVSTLRTRGHGVVILQGPDETGVGDEIMAHVAQSAKDTETGRVGVAKLTGSLGVAAAILDRADFYVGTDSGLAHLAAAVGRRAVTLFAPADPDRVCPFGNRDLVVQPAKQCCPCFLYPWDSARPKMRCTEPMCVTEITVGQVMQAVDRVGVHRPLAAGARDVG